MDNGDPRFPYPRYLKVPFVFVPDGNPPPLQWMRDNPNYVTVRGVFIPHPPSETGIASEPRPEPEGQLELPQDVGTYEVVIDYAGNFVARPVPPLTPQPAPWTELPPEADGRAEPQPEEPIYEEPAPEPEVEPEPPPRPAYLRCVPPPGPRRARGGPPPLGPNPAARGIDPLAPEFAPNLVRKTARIMAGMDRVMRPGGIATDEGLSAAVRAGMQHLAAHKGDVVAALASAKSAGAGWRDPVPEVGLPADIAMVSRTAPHINIEADLAGSLTSLTSDVTSGNFGQGEETSRLMPGVQTAGAEEEEEPGDDELDPFAEVRAQEFSAIQAQIAQLDPASPFAASISAPGWVPTQNDLYQIEGALDEKIDEIASEIASGHASGGATDYAFRAMINATIRNPSKSGTLRRGRSYYYDQPNNFVVIVDPNGADGGTAFHPATGSSYLKTLE